MWLPRTIEENEEVAVDESESEEEVPSKERRRTLTSKKQIFNDDFSFLSEGGGAAAVEGGWEVEEEVMEWAEKKRDLVVTSLDSKILRTIEQRKLKVWMPISILWSSVFLTNNCRQSRDGNQSYCRAKRTTRRKVEL